MAITNKVSKTAKKPVAKKTLANKIVDKLDKANKPDVVKLVKAPEKINGMFLLAAPAIIDVDDVDAVIAEDLAKEHASLESQTTPYKVDISAGKDGDDFTLSNEWAKRPKDQRFTSYTSYRDFVLNRKRSTIERGVTAKELHAIPSQTALEIEGHDKPIALSNYAYNQLCSLTGLPRSFVQHCPPELSSKMWGHALSRLGDGVAVANIEQTNESHDRLRALVPQTYGHIWDADMIKLLEEEIFQGDNRWKIPGEYNWGTGFHNPNVQPDFDSTSLFASDRDTVGFLCQDGDPIECGLTTRGKPDIFFPGLLWSNNEVGSGDPAKVKLMFLRGVCFNRSLRGVDVISDVTCRHTKNGATTLRQRILEMGSQLRGQRGFTQFRDKVMAAKNTPLKIQAEQFLTKTLLLSKPQATEVIRLVKIEEGQPIASFMDVSNGITALARKIPYQNKRVGLEMAAANVLDIAYAMAA